MVLCVHRVYIYIPELKYLLLLQVFYLFNNFKILKLCNINQKWTVLNVYIVIDNLKCYNTATSIFRLVGMNYQVNIIVLYGLLVFNPPTSFFSFIFYIIY